MSMDVNADIRKAKEDATAFTMRYNKQALYYVYFSKEEYDLIEKYRKAVDAIDAITAIMNAISIALDDADNKVENRTCTYGIFMEPLFQCSKGCDGCVFYKPIGE